MARPASAPSLRLAVGGGLDHATETLGPPDLRLAYNKQPAVRRALGQDAPVLRLAHMDGAQGTNVLVGQRSVEKLPADKGPALLVSYVYASTFLPRRARYVYRDWAMDSGAWSAFKSGVKVDLGEFTRTALDLLAGDETLTEVFSLDVLGDWRAGLRNTEAMWRAGVPAIPCWHVGEPLDLLSGLARDYPKIAVGGLVPLRGDAKRRVLGQVFGRTWPTKVHGFAVAVRGLLLEFPFHSVDATSWELGPCKFGHWKSFGNAALRIRGGAQNLRSEVEYYLRVEAEARSRWRADFERVGWVEADAGTPASSGPG